jgi:Flp pilus assembly pilin Flp
MYILYKYYQNFVKHEEGQGTVEYALMIIIVALGAIAGMQTLATALNSILGHAGAQIGTAT